MRGCGSEGCGLVMGRSDLVALGVFSKMDVPLLQGGAAGSQHWHGGPQTGLGAPGEKHSLGFRKGKGSGCGSPRCFARKPSRA